MSFQAKHLTYIAKVTEMLNQIPADDDLHVRVVLYDEDGDPIGRWSDEIGPDSWTYEGII